MTTTDIPAGVNADLAFRCKGDCMIGARLYDGDIVFIRKQATVENGQIAAVYVDGEPLLKRVYVYDDHIILTPENPKYRPLAFWGDEKNRVQIIGRAVAFTAAIQ